MNPYSRYIFPCVLDWAMNRPTMEAQRTQVLEAARGDVLEVGLGTGRNLPHYGPDVRHVYALEPNPGMARRARRRIDAARVPVTYLHYADDGASTRPMRASTRWCRRGRSAPWPTSTARSPRSAAC